MRSRWTHRALLRWTPFLSAFSLILPAVVSAGTGYFSNPGWDNGKAEFCIYEATIGRYGEARQGTVKMILVKERFDPIKLVKTNKGGRIRSGPQVPNDTMGPDRDLRLLSDGFDLHRPGEGPGAQVHDGQPGRLRK